MAGRSRQSQLFAFPSALVAAVVSGVGLASAFLYGFDMPIQARVLATATAALFCGIWFLPPHLERGRWRLARIVGWSLAVPGSVLILTAAMGDLPFAAIGKPAMAAALMLAATAATVAAGRNRGWRATGNWIFLGFLITAASCLWLGPAAELMADRPWVASAIVNVNPVTFLAVSVEYDYLLETWFYQRTAFGSLRYQYWPLNGFVVASVLVIIVASGDLLLRSRKTDPAR